MTLPLPANWGSGSSFSATAENNVEAAVNALGAGTLTIPRHVSSSNAGSLTLTSGYNAYIFTGTTATWTLPLVSATTGAFMTLYNRGSGSITVQRAGSDNLFTGSTVTSLQIGPGSSLDLINDGTYWLVITSFAPQPVYDNSVQGTSTQSSAIGSGVANTWTHIVGAGNPYGIVCLYTNAIFNSTTGVVPTVTFGGVTLTQIGYSPNTSSNRGIWVFGGAAIPAGSQTVSVTLTQAGQSFAYAPFSFTYLNVIARGAFVSLQSSAIPFVPLPRSTSLPTRAWCALTTSTGTSVSAVSGHLRQHYDGGGGTSTGWGFDAGISGIDSATYGIGMNSTPFAAAALELFGQNPTGPYLNTVGSFPLTNISSLGQTANTFLHLSTAGTYVLVSIMYLKSGSTSLGGVTFGGSAMTQLANKYCNNDSSGASGQLFVYGIANVSGGPQTVALTYTGGTPSTLIANAVSYHQVSAVGTAAAVSGTGTSLSQGPISAASGQVIFQAFSTYDNASALLETGTESNLYSGQVPFSNGALSLNHVGSASNTFTATSNSAAPWAGIAVVLS